MVECITVFLSFSTLREIERDGVLIKNNILKQEGQWTLDRSTESLSGREDVKPQLHCDDSGYDSSRTDGKIGMHQDESGWKKKKIQHQYDVSQCSNGVCTVNLRIHYDS